MAERVLIVVDMQKDFMPDGALPIEGGYDIVAAINELMDGFDLVVGTQDWHPPGHQSFASNHDGHEVGDTIEVEGLDQYLWPDHCIQETEGAEFVDELDSHKFDQVIQKAQDPRYDSYSAFFDNGHQTATGLRELLEQREVEEVYVCGVATDVCVLYTVLDARRIGFSTRLIIDACRGVATQPGDIEKAVAEMSKLGADMVAADVVLGRE